MVFVDDRDEDLIEETLGAEGDEPEGSKADKKAEQESTVKKSLKQCVRICTVDNFQV